MRTDRRLARRRLDETFNQLRPLARTPRPHRGWIRAIREALGMSADEMAARMGVINQNVFQLERSEANDRIQLGTLRQAAAALDCDLVYALIPRMPLDEAVASQAKRKAAAIVRPVAHHSRLEDQSLTVEETTAQIDELVARLVDRRGLWREQSVTQ